MSIAITLFTVLLLFVCLLMVLIILMQRPKQEGLGAAFGGGMTDQMFGAQTTNVLQKGTVYFAIFYFVASAAIAVLVSNKQEQSEASKELLNENAPAAAEVVDPAAAVELPVETAPAIETAPAEETAPAVETAPVEETAPAVETVPAEETTPVEETAPVEESAPEVEAGGDPAAEGIEIPAVPVEDPAPAKTE